MLGCRRCVRKTFSTLFAISMTSVRWQTPLICSPSFLLSRVVSFSLSNHLAGSLVVSLLPRRLLVMCKCVSEKPRSLSAARRATNSSASSSASCSTQCKRRERERERNWGKGDSTKETQGIGKRLEQVWRRNRHEGEGNIESRTGKRSDSTRVSEIRSTNRVFVYGLYNVTPFVRLFLNLFRFFFS